MLETVTRYSKFCEHESKEFGKNSSGNCFAVSLFLIRALFNCFLFVYGKNLADSELTLENVGNKGAADNAGTVKILYNKNSAEQIALDYGLSKKDGKISAVAFVITKTADGTLKPTMSNIESYTY